MEGFVVCSLVIKVFVCDRFVGDFFVVDVDLWRYFCSGGCGGILDGMVGVFLGCFWCVDVLLCI